MAPQISSFSSADLAARVQLKSDGTRRKEAIDLKKDCKLQELVQYNCRAKDSKVKPQTSTITCSTIVRTFRRCKGDLLVETTGWKDEIYAGEEILAR